MPEDQRLSPAHALAVLAQGQIEVQGRLPWSSNYTFLVTCAWEGVELPAVYKPERGERPLWDFGSGLFRREAAAYQLSVALGYGLVPETLIRHDAPLGTGSLQRFVPADFAQHYFTLIEDPAHHDTLRALCVFDLVANNADRKGGHCLLGEDGRIWGIDNGLCFHPEPRLRTVIWDFADEPVPECLRPGVEALAAEPPSALAELLAPDEREALARRAGALATRPRFPAPRPGRRPYPW
ncbi:MAG TPA: SCO1664 family protein, partial [Acidimicrobiales bacterium]|nr:SCO1664 family protein [Acidimicrobiales bacterium]